MTAEPWPDDPAADMADVPPHDVEAERKVLSAMLGDPDSIDAVAPILDPGDFYRPAHSVTYRALLVMRAAGVAIEVETVRDWIFAEGDSAALGGSRSGLYLVDLFGLHTRGFSAAGLARVVADRAARRRWLEAATRIRQQTRETGDLDDMNAACLAEADAAAVTAGDYSPRAARLTGAWEHTARASAKPAAVIPGVLNRMDRVVVVGSPGSGKTVLALQHAAAASVGIHPFGSDRFDPVRVLWIDLEMPDYLSGEDLQLVMRTARCYGNPEMQGRFQVLHRPRGIRLEDKGQAQLLAGLIRKAAPDLVVAGPVYKMHADRGERSDHTLVMDFWDDMRDRHGFALWLETHPAKEVPFGGKRKLTPAGSSRWGDWPEIGFGIVGDSKDSNRWDVVPFRGMRDRSRQWPASLTVNLSGSGWPWHATYPQAVL